MEAGAAEIQALPAAAVLWEEGGLPPPCIPPPLFHPPPMYLQALPMGAHAAAPARAPLGGGEGGAAWGWPEGAGEEEEEGEGEDGILARLGTGLCSIPEEELRASSMTLRASGEAISPGGCSVDSTFLRVSAPPRVERREAGGGRSEKEKDSTAAALLLQFAEAQRSEARRRREAIPGAGAAIPGASNPGEGEGAAAEADAAVPAADRHLFLQSLPRTNAAIPGAGAAIPGEEGIGGARAVPPAAAPPRRPNFSRALTLGEDERTGAPAAAVSGGRVGALSGAAIGKAAISDATLGEAAISGGAAAAPQPDRSAPRSDAAMARLFPEYAARTGAAIRVKTISGAEIPGAAVSGAAVSGVAISGAAIAGAARPASARCALCRAAMADAAEARIDGSRRCGSGGGLGGRGGGGEATAEREARGAATDGADGTDSRGDGGHGARAESNMQARLVVVAFRCRSPRSSGGSVAARSILRLVPSPAPTTATPVSPQALLGAAADGVSPLGLLCVTIIIDTARRAEAPSLSARPVAGAARRGRRRRLTGRAHAALPRPSRSEPLRLCDIFGARRAEAGER